jgi:hypothetical protein
MFYIIIKREALGLIMFIPFLLGDLYDRDLQRLNDDMFI